MPIPDFRGYSEENKYYPAYPRSPEEASTEIYNTYDIKELSMLEKHEREEALPSSQLYNIPFNIIPGSPGQFIPSYEKIDYPDAPLHLYPKIKKNTIQNKKYLIQIKKKKRYNKYIRIKRR